MMQLRGSAEFLHCIAALYTSGAHLKQEKLGMVSHGAGSCADLSKAIVAHVLIRDDLGATQTPTQVLSRQPP